jgi:signal transduction histidine kinase
VIEAQDQARHALARDLHDGPTQLVSGLVMRLDFCRQALDKNPALLTKELPGLQKLAEQATHQMRTALLGLRPLILEAEGLATALQTFLDRRQTEIEQPRLTLKLKTHQANGAFSRQEPQVEAALFAIAQEAVNNAIKHAQAREIEVFLKETPLGMYLIIRDDGLGFDLKQVRQGYGQRGSLGLLNMQERAELIGGEFTLSSEPGQGTHLSIYVPKAGEERQQKRYTTGLLRWLQ